MLADCTGESQQIEVVLVRPDGTRVSIEMRASLIHDDDGAIAGALGIQVDVTARRDAAITRANLGAIITSSDDAIISKTLDGRIVS